MAQLHYEAYRAPQHPGQSHGYAPQQGYPQGYPQGHPQGYPQDHPQGSAPEPRRVGRLVNLIGALLSVALITGVGIWTYRLMVRDVAGVPVIRALAGPIRISPEDPGGRQAAYQGLAVNNVAAEGGAADAAQTIALAPPPVQLSDEDRAFALIARSGTAPAQPLVQPVAQSAAQSAAQPAAQPIVAPPAIAGAPANVAPQPAQPITQPASPAQPQQLALIPATRAGVSRSPVPPPRPGGSRLIASAAAAATPVAATAPAAPNLGVTAAQAEALLQELVTRLGPAQAIDIDPTTLTPGTRLVQLGAYDSDADARTAWNTLSARFPAYLEGRGRIVEAASAGGRTFYRLRAHGFTDEPEARRFCSVFLAENADCIPVLIR